MKVRCTEGDPWLLPVGCRVTDQAVSAGQNLDSACFVFFFFYQVLMNRKSISIVQLVWCENSSLETETESGRGRERPSGAGVEAQTDTSETWEQKRSSSVLQTGILACSDQIKK